MRRINPKGGITTKWRVTSLHDEYLGYVESVETDRGTMFRAFAHLRDTKHVNLGDEDTRGDAELTVREWFDDV